MIGTGDTARAALYKQLATLENAGIPLPEGLQRVAGSGGGQAIFGPILERVRAGETVGEAFQESGTVSALEAAVVTAGAEGGTLPRSFNQLSEIFQERADTKRGIAAKVAYPIFLIHAAIVLTALPTLVQDAGLPGFLYDTLVPLGTLYAITFGGLFLYKSAKAASPIATDGFVLRIPLIGGIARKNAAAISLRALAILYGNGVSILRALDLAAQTSPNAVVARVFTEARTLVADGEPLDAAFASSGDVLPGIALDMIATGNRTGQLDETLSKACDILDDEAKTGRTTFAMLLGGAAFGAAALMVAYKVISFWSGYADQINRATGS